MSESHDHDHSHDDHGHHHHDDDAPLVLKDPAQQSLADALRVSFRVLTIIMVVVIAVYLFTGVVSVPPQQVGVMKIFGRQVGTAQEGLAYTWPFPIGKIELVATKQQEVAVSDFWMHETAEDKATKMEDRAAPDKGLRPGWDGALLTGDRYLLHVDMVCMYVIRDPEIFLTRVRDEKNLRELVRSAVCRAAIRAAATRTADGIQTEREGFRTDMRRWAQEEVDAVLGKRGAVVVREVTITRTTWPLRAMPAYRDAQKAASERKKRIDEARAEEARILNGACGPNAAKLLVGERPSMNDEDVPMDQRPLITQYAEALRKKKGAEAAALLARIDQVLLGTETSGDASRILEQARSESTAIKQDAKRRSDRFRSLVGEFRTAPDILLARHWARTLDEILSAKTVEKFIFALGKGKTILKLNRDPDITRTINRELMKKSNEANKKKPGE